MFRFFLGALICAGLMATDAVAQDNSAGQLPDTLRQALPSVVERSLSGQFYVFREPRQEWAPVFRSAQDDIALVQLEPSLLVVSCERIKKAFLNEVGGADNWRGKISVVLHSYESWDEGVVVTSTKYDDGWSYRLDLPDRIESPKLILAVVNALLQEMANRQVTDHPAEIPVWLSRGLSQQILRSSDVELVIKAPKASEHSVSLDTSGTWEGDRTNTLGQAHEELQNFPPLTLDQLSWYTDDQYTGFAGQGARGSAQLFFYDLTHLDDGRECMRSFIQELPNYLNWQFALLKAYHTDFESQLDLEKWWTLHVVNFTGRNLAQTWPSDESWAKLDEIIHPTAEVRAAPDDTPEHTAMSLQNIIRESDFDAEAPVFKTMVQRLYVLRIHVSQEVIPLVDGYRQALQDYLNQGSRAGASRSVRGQMFLDRDSIARETIQELDELDARRKKLEPRPEHASQSKNDPGSVVVSH